MNNPLEDFDPTIIATVLTEMMKKLVSEPTSETEVEIKVKVPTAIVEGFEKISGVLGLDSNELLGNLASHGVNASLQGLMQIKKQADPPADGTPSMGGIDLKTAGFDLGMFGDEFAQLGGLMNQLKEMQSMVTDAAKPFGYEVPNSKDTKKS